LCLNRETRQDIEVRDGTEHSFYAQFNKTDSIKHALVVYENERPVGCGAFKVYKTSCRNKKNVCQWKIMEGIASTILKQLESWARENFKSCIWKPVKYPEAIALYKKNGFHHNLNYGQYEG
jgi:GNAT superfamily N-acetyltransferase